MSEICTNTSFYTAFIYEITNVEVYRVWRPPDMLYSGQVDLPSYQKMGLIILILSEK